MSTERFTRRNSLARLGGALAAAAGGRALLSPEAAGGNKAVESGAVQCVLTPELTEGPYYIAGEKLRRDIGESHPGTVLTAGTSGERCLAGLDLRQRRQARDPQRHEKRCGLRRRDLDGSA